MPVLHWVRVRKAGWLVDHSRRLHNWFAVTLLGLPSPESSPSGSWPRPHLGVAESRRARFFTCFSQDCTKRGGLPVGAVLSFPPAAFRHGGPQRGPVGGGGLVVPHSKALLSASSAG